jgi:hypothetical protein
MLALVESRKEVVEKLGAEFVDGTWAGVIRTAVAVSGAGGLPAA